MHITHLSLTNFRNYSRLELPMPMGATLLYGDNAQGKTNLLEAIYYLATSKSPQADQDKQLINWEAAEDADNPLVVGRLVANIERTDGKRVVEIRLIQETHGNTKSFRREVLVNRRKVRVMDLLGNLRVVLFLPHDIQLITGSPALRRRYLNITLCQTDPIYCRALSGYNKQLDQRNALLRSIAETGYGGDMLPIFTDKLIELGGIVLARRAQLTANLAREAQAIHYESLTNGRETLRLGYLPRLMPMRNGRVDDEKMKPFLDVGEWVASNCDDVGKVQERFAQALAEYESEDLARGSTQIGPHRDDWAFWVNGRSLASFGSRGQQRSSILALKLAEINWITKQTGDTPILLLDEVLAELDEQRRSLLLDTVERVNQSLMTATDLGMFKSDFTDSATTLNIHQGQVEITN